MRSKGLKAWHLDTRRMVAALQPEGAHAAVAALAASPADSYFACASAVAASGSFESSNTGFLMILDLICFYRCSHDGHS